MHACVHAHAGMYARAYTFNNATTPYSMHNGAHRHFMHLCSTQARACNLACKNANAYARVRWIDLAIGVHVSMHMRADGCCRRERSTCLAGISHANSLARWRVCCTYFCCANLPVPKL